MTEKRFRSLVIKMLDPIGAFAVENSAGVGVPDICTVAGWIELKIASWPIRLETKISVDLRKTQVIWLRRWVAHGGKAWTLTDIEGEWFLHKASWACDFLGNSAEAELRENAVPWRGVHVNTCRPDQRILIDTLLGGN